MPEKTSPPEAWAVIAKALPNIHPLFLLPALPTTPCLEASGYFEFIKNTNRSFGFTGYGLEARLRQTPAGIGAPSTYTPELNGSKSQNATASYIGLLRYTFNNKYTVNGGYRYDGSSMVPLKNRWHGFYSAGASWEAKRENFLEDVAFLSNLRFRGS